MARDTDTGTLGTGRTHETATRLSPAGGIGCRRRPDGGRQRD
jgi:hypothetical protein